MSDIEKERFVSTCVTFAVTRAIVLAAGAGTRLRGMAVVKPLVPLVGRPLLRHVLDRLTAAGVTEAVIVVGYEADRIRAALDCDLPCRVTIVDNPRWAEPNGVSLLAAAPQLDGPALLCMADHLVDPALYRRVAAADGLALGIDRRLGHAWVDEADVTRVATRAGRVVRLGKGLATYDAYDTGVFRIAPALADALARLDRPSLSSGVGVLAARGEVAAIDCSDLDWIDIDDPRALALAEALILR